MTTPFFSQAQGMLLIAGYAIAALAVTWFFARQEHPGKESFLLAERSVGLLPSAFSIAATWIWAPALFIASAKAYTQGIAGLFWFTVPNVLCLIVFASFAERVRAKLPDGFTLSGFILERFSRRVQALYWIELTGLAACSFAVQLLAGGRLIEKLTGLPFFGITMALALIACAYSLFSGLRASVVTDVAQLTLIFVVGLTLVPWAVARAGAGTLLLGLGGQSGGYDSLWNAKGLDVAWSFGIPVTIGLMAGPFGDQSFWQRAYAVKRDDLRGAFFLGALLFGIVPLLLSLLGFIAAASPWEIESSDMVGLEAILQLLPGWTILPFTYMLMSGLLSTLDSNLCAMASLAGHDFLRAKKGPAEDASARVVRLSRWSMVALAIAGILIANIPGMQILYLFLFYGTLRASTLVPTMLAATDARIHERGVFYGILVAFLLGLPLFATGNFGHHPGLTVAGSLLTVLSSGGIAWLDSCRRARAGGEAVGLEKVPPS